MLNIVKLILYQIVAAAILFFFFEFLTRIFYPEIQPYGSDEVLVKQNVYNQSSGLNPNAVGYSQGVFFQVDPFGFRKYHTVIDTTLPSLLLIGDSVTMGLGVEADSTFAGILQNQLDSINVLNPSLFGYTVRDYQNVAHAFISEKRFPFHIDRMFIAYCLNDVYGFDSYTQMPGGSLRSFLGDVLLIIKSKSRFYLLLKKLLFDRPKSYFLFDQRFYQPGNPQFQETLRIIENINASCRKHKIDFSILILPYEYQLRKAHTSMNSPQKLLIDSLSAKKIVTYDLEPFLRKNMISSEDLFLFGDGIHFSKNGHRLIAQFIFENLLTNVQ